MTRLMGSYPSLNLHDPETYSAELIALLERYPAWAGERGIIEARKASPKFPPSVAEVETALEAIYGPARAANAYALQWEARARKQLRERRDQEQRDAATTPEERREHVRRVLGYVPGERQEKPAVSRETPKRYPWEDDEPIGSPLARSGTAG